MLDLQTIGRTKKDLELRAVRANGLRNLNPSQWSDLHGATSGTTRKKAEHTNHKCTKVRLSRSLFRTNHKRQAGTILFLCTGNCCLLTGKSTDAATLPREAAAYNAGTKTVVVPANDVRGNSSTITTRESGESTWNDLAAHMARLPGAGSYRWDHGWGARMASSAASIALHAFRDFHRENRMQKMQPEPPIPGACLFSNFHLHAC